MCFFGWRLARTNRYTLKKTAVYVISVHGDQKDSVLSKLVALILKPTCREVISNPLND